ncbi:tripartite tricarboxylate transporter substrate binding protein [Pigmentiphaga soli]|uniref:Tripartite tricarboxylate transporter substrate binding protein n=1 Tax=Pigmentiphaga soli TaxID=1007095 RepID=A0ABP8GRB9_9BURK
MEKALGMEAGHRARTAARLAAAIVLAGISVAAGAQAQQPYPAGPVTLVTPFTPGSGSDATARAAASTLGPVLGQTVVVQNVAGAGGAIGARQVAKAAPDGYTLLLASISFSVIPSLMKVGFDPVKDFRPVTMLGLQPFVLVVPESLPANSVSELVALAKARPGKFNYASAGVGSIGHLQWELLKTERGIDLVHVPYKGTPETVVGMLAGEVQMSLVSLPAAMPQIKAGKLKALGVTGDKRAPELPSVPTMAEAGFPSLGDSVWYAILAPAGTPQAVVDKLNAAFGRTLRDPETISRLAAVGTDATTSSPQEAADYVRAQVAKWGKVVSDAKIRVEN